MYHYHVQAHSQHPISTHVNAYFYLSPSHRAFSKKILAKSVNLLLWAWCMSQYGWLQESHSAWWITFLSWLQLTHKQWRNDLTLIDLCCFYETLRFSSLSRSSSRLCCLQLSALLLEVFFHCLTLLSLQAQGLVLGLVHIPFLAQTSFSKVEVVSTVCFCYKNTSCLVILEPIK